MKKMMMVMGLVMLAAAQAQAADSFRIDLNGGERYLPECGGTMEAFTSNRGIFTGAEQINLVLRNVKNCSNFVLQTTGQEYKMEGPNGDRGGSFTLPSYRLNTGWNQINLTVRSNSGKHDDQVSIWVNVRNSGVITPAPVPVPGGAMIAVCQPLAESYARAEVGMGAAHGRFDRLSNSGNFVYEVSVSVFGTFEVVVNPTNCAKLSVTRK